jgi:hypothetical protein
MVMTIPDTIHFRIVGINSDHKGSMTIHGLCVGLLTNGNGRSNRTAPHTGLI